MAGGRREERRKHDAGAGAGDAGRNPAVSCRFCLARHPSRCLSFLHFRLRMARWQIRWVGGFAAPPDANPLAIRACLWWHRSARSQPSLKHKGTARPPLTTVVQVGFSVSDDGLRLSKVLCSPREDFVSKSSLGRDCFHPCAHRDMFRNAIPRRHSYRYPDNSEITNRCS